MGHNKIRTSFLKVLCTRLIVGTSREEKISKLLSPVYGLYPGLQYILYSILQYNPDIRPTPDQLLADQFFG